MNKYRYLIVIQFKYGDDPWEDIDEYEEKDWKECRRVLKEYRMSGDGHYRMIHRRERISG